MIKVQRLNPTTFLVTISGPVQTTHTVTVPASYAERLTDGSCSVEHLIRTSFTFLLEREPNTSILREFELSLIGHYFPEYETEIRDLL